MRTLVTAVCSLFVSLGAAAQPMTIQVVAKGKILSMANPEKRERSVNVDIITKYTGNPRCVSSGAQVVSLDAGCVIDTTRTYTTSTTPQCPSSYGQGGAGYGIVVQSCLSHDGWGASHSLSGGTLTSNLEVCRKKNTTQRGWYKAKHVLYMNCPVLVDWTQTYPFNHTATGTAWQYVGTLSPPPPPGVQNLTFTISISPSNLVVQSGLFSGNPNLSGNKGLNLWIKPGDNDLTVTGLEVSQGVQNLQNAMPLVARRRTLIRAYVRASLNNVNAVRASLAAYRNNVSLGAPIEAENTPAIRTNGGTRATLDDAFWFHVPPAWRDQTGPVKFVVTVDSTNSVPELNETNNSREVTVGFAAVPPMIITGVPLHMHVDADRNKPVLTMLQSDQYFWHIAANLSRMHPAWTVQLQDCGTPIQYPGFHGSGQEWDMTNGGVRALILYRVMSTRALSGCGTSSMHWIGLVHPSVNTGGILGMAIPFGRSSWVQMTPTGDNSTPWRVTGGETMAHELGHNAGLPHVRCDGSEGFPVADFYPHPAPNCRLAVGDDGYYGLDVHYQDWGHAEPAVISNNPAAPSGKRAFPIMGYKTPGWADPFDYCLLLLSNGVPCNPLQMASPVIAREVTEPLSAHAPNGFLTIGGVLDLRTNTFLALDVAHTDTVGANALVPTPILKNPTERRALLALAQVDAAGNQLSATPVETPAADGDPSFVPFLRTVAKEAQTAGIELRLGPTVLTRRMASANKPVVQLLEPNGGTLSATTRVRWSATDADGDALMYTLSYSPDGGQTWRVIATDLQQPAMTLPAGTRLPGSTTGVLRIQANDGFNTSHDDSTNPITVSTSPPIPVIQQPGSVIAIQQPGFIAIQQSRTLLLEGRATDIDEGAITAPESFRWSSDRDGPLAQGRELYTRTLSRGVHVVTLEVLDAEGMSGRTSVRVYVGVPMPARVLFNAF